MFEENDILSDGVKKTPNAVTVAAMLEAEHIENDPTVKRYADVEEALRALK